VDDAETVSRAAEAYLSADDELTARRVLNAHRGSLGAIEQSAAQAARPTRPGRRRFGWGRRASADAVGPADQVRRRLALLRRAIEIGPTDAFFEAAERQDLPFPRAARSEPDLPDKLDLPAELVSLLLQAFPLDDAHSADAAALQENIAACERVIAHPSFDQLPHYLRVNNLNHAAVARAHLFALIPQADNLERRIELLHDAVNAVDGGDYIAPGLLSNLGIAYEDRYRMTGALADLEESLRARTRSVDEAAIGHDGLVTFLNSQANSLWSASGRLGGDLDRQAASVYERALRWCPPQDPRRPGIESNLADVYLALRQRSIYLLRPKETERYTELAVAHGKNAAEQTPRDSPHYPRHLVFYARALDAAATFLPDEKRREEQAEALRYARLAVDHSPPSSQGHSAVLTQYADLARKTGGVPAETIAGCYREACRRGLEVDPSATIEAARRWAHLARDRSDWAEETQAWSYALRAMQLLFRAQTLRGHQETRLRGFGTIPVEAAQAAARAGMPVEAVLALEQGRAMILSQRLSRELADLGQLEREGHVAGAVRFRSAAAALERLQAQTADLTRGLAGSAGTTGFELSRRQLQAARREYDEAVTAIQELPGHADFLRTVSYADIARAAQAAPIVYLVAARSQGMALRVTAEGEPTIEVLPGLRDNELAEQVRGLLRSYRGGGSDAGTWPDQLDQTCRWLWTTVLGPCFDSGLISGRAVLVPVGQLSLLPLHAAWRAEEAAVGGRRYALDEALLTYAPSAQAVAAAEKRAAGALAHRALAVVDPSPTSAASLPAAAAEAGAATEFFAERSVLRGPAASRQAVLDALAAHQVLHFACHAWADDENPLESALLLANDERLRLSDIIRLTLRNARLSFLSACETAVIGEELPDEMIGLHTALLQAGVPGVVGSLWAVLDESTGLLVARFYERWRKQGLPPPEALREAQKWLRGATNAEIAALTGTGPQRPLGQAAYQLWGSARAHAHPRHWAAFAYTGV
jgi:CHAT domain-containing protein